MTVDFMKDKNKIAKAIAAYLRNKIEGFHVAYLSDEQMRELNTLIRDAVFSFLIDFGDDYSKISSPKNEKKCYKYIESLTTPFLKQTFNDKIIKKFNDIISEYYWIALADLANGALMLTLHYMFFVPTYWEDCEYVNLK